MFLYTTIHSTNTIAKVALI